MDKSKILLFSCLFFISGIALASFSSKINQVESFYCFAGGCLLFVFGVIFWPQPRLRFSFFLALFLLLGVWRYNASLPQPSPDQIWRYNGKEVLLRGVVAAEPDLRTDKQKLTIKVDALSKKGILDGGSIADWQAVNGRVLTTTKLYPSYQYGDQLNLWCRLAAPEPINDFAYDRYLARSDIYSVCYYPPVEKIGDKAVLGRWLDGFYRRIFLFKSWARDTYYRGLDDQGAGLALGIMLGDRRGVAVELTKNFSRSGLTHIMAISGMNIAIIATAAMNIAIYLGLRRRLGFFLAIALAAVFIILVGLPASAVRSGIMVFLLLWAVELGRASRSERSLVLAAAIMLAIEPRLLRDDLGFQLSFLAVLGLAVVYPKISEQLDRLEKAKFGQWIKTRFVRPALDIFGLTIAAQVFSWPLLIFSFKQFSLVAPVANLFVLWVVPLIMAGAFAAMLLSALMPIGTVVFFLPVKLLLWYFAAAVNFFGGWRYASLETAYIWWGWLAVYYWCLSMVLLKKKKVAQLN